MTGDETAEKVNGETPKETTMTGNGTVANPEGPSAQPCPAKDEDERTDTGSEVAESPDKVEGTDPQKGAEEQVGMPSQGEADGIPKAVLLPIQDFDSERVEAPSGMSLPTREELVSLLVSKHLRMVDEYTNELGSLEATEKEPETNSVQEKEHRDQVNFEVQRLKEERKVLRERNKGLGTELFSMLDKQELLKERAGEMARHQKYIADLEWKIETEDIKIEQERKHLDEIKDTLRKIREMTEGFTPDEIKQRIDDLQEEIGNNLLLIEDRHRKMLERVDESNVHHDKYMDAQRKAREREARKGWLTRRVELHAEMGKFWDGQREMARKNDSEESLRSIGQIRDSLVVFYAGREPDGASNDGTEGGGPQGVRSEGREGQGRTERGQRGRKGPARGSSGNDSPEAATEGGASKTSQEEAGQSAIQEVSDTIAPAATEETMTDNSASGGGA